MFYIDHYNSDGTVAIADSDDGAIDIVTKQEMQEYQNQGIQILTWNEAKAYVTGRMNHNCNYYLWRKLNRNCSEDELMEYFQKYSNYTIVHNANSIGSGIDYSKRCRIFNYVETLNYYIIVLFLKNGFPLVLRIDAEFECISYVIQEPCIFKSYPSCSGFMVKQLLNKKNILGNYNLKADEVYLILYSLETKYIVLFNQFTFQVSYINNKGEILC